MADAVTTQVINNGERNLILKLTNKGDGTGESAVVKAAAATYGCDSFSLLCIEYDISGIDVELLWDGTPNKSIIKLAGNGGSGKLDWHKSAGVPNNAASSNGDLLLTTTGHSGSGDFYTITLHLKKKYA